MMNDCCLCDKKLDDKYGHNAQPIMDGNCCGSCNTRFVIPTRLMEMNE